MEFNLKDVIHNNRDKKQLREILKRLVLEEASWVEDADPGLKERFLEENLKVFLENYYLIEEILSGKGTAPNEKKGEEP